MNVMVLPTNLPPPPQKDAIQLTIRHVMLPPPLHPPPPNEFFFYLVLLLPNLNCVYIYFAIDMQ